MKAIGKAVARSVEDRNKHVLLIRIVGFVVVLILLLSILAGYTLYRLGSINDESEEFEEIEIPLLNVVNGLQELQLEQHLTLNEIYRYSIQEEDKEKRDSEIQKSMKLFDEQETQIEGKLVTGISLAEKAQGISDRIAEQYNDIHDLLLEMQDKNLAFGVNVNKLVVMIDNDESENATILFRELETEADDLDRRAKIVYNLIWQFEDESVRGIEEHRASTVEITGLIVIAETTIATVLGTYVAMFTARHIEERRRVEEEQRKSEQKYRFLIEKQGEGIVISNEDEVFTFSNPAADGIFGVQRGKLVGRTIQEFSTPEMTEVIEEQNRRHRDGEQTSYEVEIDRPEGERRHLFITATPWLAEDGRYVGSFEIFRDITVRKKGEEQIKASLREKEVLLKEIHHRVKNNLQIISSLLDFQTDGIDDDHVRGVFLESQTRIRSMAYVHERLYHSHDLARVDLAEYLWELASYLFRSYSMSKGLITLEEDIDELSLGLDIAIPCGLIVNELVSNSLKYAFPDDRDGVIHIGLHETDDDMLTLVVKDNGTGFPEDLDYENTKSLGLRLVNMLTRQLDGTIELDGSGGAEFRITFPKQYEK